MSIGQNLILDGTKLIWHMDRVKAWLNGERIAPLYIECAITTDCSYNCTFCYGQLQRKGTGGLPRDVVMKFLDDAADIGVKAVALIGDGENTCNPCLKEAIIHGKSKGLDMALGTNGYLLKDEDLEEILPCLTYLRFNISAGTPEGYSKIHGVSEKCYYKVLETIRKAVEIKKKLNLPVTIGLQMVLLPEFGDEIMPLARLGKENGVDYLVIKHCSDDEDGTLGVDYKGYAQLEDLLKQAQALSSPDYLVKPKWSKITSEGKRSYSHCYGPAFVLQVSGAGIVAPCGMFFNDKYKKYHIGSLMEQGFKEMWQSERYWQVLDMIKSDGFDARKDCGTLCHQHKVNEMLDMIMSNRDKDLPEPEGPEPDHINFI